MNSLRVRVLAAMERRRVGVHVGGGGLSTTKKQARQTTKLRTDGLQMPKPGRIGNIEDYEECMRAHAQARAEGNQGYMDPKSGLFVMTADFLRARGFCCNSGCRHCPYEDLEEDIGE